MTWNESTLTLDVVTDLGGQVEPSELRTAIEPLLTPGIEYFIRKEDVVTAKLAAVPPQAEKDAVAAEVATYAAGALARAKKERKAEHSKEFTEVIFKHYAQPQQTSLALYRSEAQFGALPNRAAYIGQAIGWIDACFTAYYAKNDEIDAQGTIAEAKAVAWDYSGLEAADPKVTLRAAREILD